MRISQLLTILIEFSQQLRHRFEPEPEPWQVPEAQALVDTIRQLIDGLEILVRTGVVEVDLYALERVSAASRLPLEEIFTGDPNRLTAAVTLWLFHKYVPSRPWSLETLVRQEAEYPPIRRPAYAPRI